MRVLVTGAGGFLGRNLVEHLADEGVEVIGTHRRHCDLLDRGSVFSLFQDAKPTHVVHCAGFVRGIGGNLAYQERAYRENVLINTHVVTQCWTWGVEKIVALGTVAMYPGYTRQWREDEVESDTPHGSEFGYAMAKRGMLAHLCTSNLNWVMPLATNMYGPHDRFDVEHGHCIPAMVRKFYDGKPVLWGTGQQRRDFLYVKDAVRALRLFLDKGAGVINMATGETHSVLEASAILAKKSGWVPEWDTSKPTGQMSRSYDVSRISELGWKPEYTLEQGLSETYDWYVAHHAEARH